MLIFSQNLANYGLPIPENAIFRVNLAWVNSLKELEVILGKHRSHQIFLDLPASRTKPPNNKYDVDDLIPIIKSNPNIKYFAVSNINTADDLKLYSNIIPKRVIIVPKIESVNGIMNIKEITNELEAENKTIMLDHDDLFSSIIKSKKPVSIFTNYISKLVVFCKKNKITLLRTVGVVFSDNEFRITQYIR